MNAYNAFKQVRDLFQLNKNSLTGIEVGRRIQQAVDLCEEVRLSKALPYEFLFVRGFLAEGLAQRPRRDGGLSARRSRRRLAASPRPSAGRLYKLAERGMEW